MNFILPLPDNLLSLASFPPSSLSDPDGLTESGTNGTENGNLESVTSGTATFNTPTAGSAYLLQLKLDWGLRLLQEGMPLPWKDTAL